MFMMFTYHNKSVCTQGDTTELVNFNISQDADQLWQGVISQTGIKQSTYKINSQIKCSYYSMSYIHEPNCKPHLGATNYTRSMV